MPLQPDDTVCYCFHVTLRKIENFCKRERPRAASQISECLSAGSGCGWCVPMLRKIHRQHCSPYQPWWRQEERGGSDSADADAQSYAEGRQKYLQEKKSPPR